MAVSPAEDILRTLKYTYTRTVGNARYSQTSGTIISIPTTGNINNGITCSFDIDCSGYKKNITSNGHYTLTFIPKPGGTPATRNLNIYLKMTSSTGTTLLDVKFSFTNLSPGKYYTLTLDVDGIVTFGTLHPRLYNMTLVLGSKSYTYDNVFGPIATCSDIFAATGLDQNDTPETPSEVVYAANNTNTQVITNIDRTY